MIIAIGCDHAAFNVKGKLIDFLKQNLGHEILDCGINSNKSVDYPSYGKKVAYSIKNNESDIGIVICGSGIGISIAANKVKGIRAALCTSVEHAIMSRKHNNANVLAMGSRFTSLEEMKTIIENWLKTEFEGGRHLDRINKIEENE